MVPLLPSDSGGLWLCNVYMSTELTMATETSGTAAPASEETQRRTARLPWSQRSLCWPGQGAECCRGSGKSLTHPFVGALHLRATTSKGVVCTTGVSATASSFPQTPPSQPSCILGCACSLSSLLHSSTSSQQRRRDRSCWCGHLQMAGAKSSNTLQSIAKEHFNHTGCDSFMES